MKRVVITGIGVITANANNKDEFEDALYNSRSGIGEVDLFDMSKMRTQLGGQVKKKFGELVNPDDNDERSVLLAKEAMKEALEDGGVSLEYITSFEDRAGISISTSLAGNARMMNYIAENSQGLEYNPKWLARIPSFLYSMVDFVKTKGPCYTTMSACAAGTAGIGIAYDMIKNGNVDLMIAGGTDPLTKFACTGFHALKSLSPTGCKPFDKDHDGIVIGEGSAFFIIETLENALARNAKIYSEILGYSINNEAYHITSPNPTGSGAYRSMKEALDKANLTIDDIDYVNAHGTATKGNDEMELKAIELLFGDKAKEVAISSTKSMTGHCLGAAGSIELVASIIALEKGFIPATATLNEPQKNYEEFNLVKGKSIKKELNYVLSNSFAFAGNTSSIVIGRYKEQVN